MTIRVATAGLLLAAMCCASTPCEAQPDGAQVCLLTLETGEWRVLQQFDRRFTVRDLAVAPDRSQIALTLQQGQRNTIFLAPSDGSPMRVLCEDASFPAWAPDGQSLLCRLAKAPTGVWQVFLDQSPSQFVHEGFSAGWSPNGTRIALYEPEGKLTVLTLGERTGLSLMDNPWNPYERLLGRPAWSPDGELLAIAALRREGGTELALLHADGPEYEFRVLTQGPLVEKCSPAWRPGGRQVVFPMFCKERELMQLYELDVDDPGPPQRVAGQDPVGDNVFAAFTPDGAQLVVISL